jgi:hypothetical protein
LGISAFPVKTVKMGDQLRHRCSLRTDERGSDSRRDDNSDDDEDGGEVHGGQKRALVNSRVDFGLYKRPPEQQIYR